MSSNNLSPAELERLAILLEECGEVLQVIGKIQRHGYHATKDGIIYDNRAHLEEELGNVLNAMDMLGNSKDVDADRINYHKHLKALTIKDYLHYQ